MSSRAAAALGWFAVAALALLGLGGVASRPEGFLLGTPPLSAVVLVVVLLGLLMRVVGVEAARPCLGLLPLPLLLLLGIRIPGLAALSGPPLLALALGAAALMLTTSGWRPHRHALFPVALALFLAGSVRTQQQVGAQGDEPHYLMVAESLLRDHDLALDHDYVQKRYGAFYHGDTLEPHYRVRGRGGEIYSLHALGLSLLILPAYATFGYPGASLFMAFVAALLVLAIRSLSRAAGASDATAEGIGWVVALSPPLAHFAPLVFTEVPAALLVAVGLAAGLGVPPGRLRALGVGAAIAFLPWLNVRYAFLTVILSAFLVLAWRRFTPSVLVLLPSVASAGLIVLYHSILYGFFDPRRVYGRRPEFALGILPEGLPGLFLDQEFGLFVVAPVFALSLPGLVALVRRRPSLAWTSLALVGVVLLVAGAWPMWRGGWNPPARFLVPLLPVFAVGLSAWLDRGTGAALAILVGWGAWVGLSGVSEPRLVHRDRDGSAPFFREGSGAEEWTRLLPRYVLGEPDRQRQAVVWGMALAAAAIAVRRRGAVRPATMLSAVLGLGAAAAVASSVSVSRTFGRDAIRVIGRPALEVPGWRPVRNASGTWTTASLDWGPVYEPHRHPDGAVVGGRLPLRAGDYCLSVEAEVLPGSLGAPVLDVRAEPVSSPRQSSFVGDPPSLEACFHVFPGETAVSLLFRGGSPLVVKALVLQDSTLEHEAGLIRQ